MSGNSPQYGQRSGYQQQADTASHAPAIIQQPNSTHGQTSQGCPATGETRFDCNTVSTIANVRQADAAERFNNLAGIEIGVGLVTAAAAVLAARWAKKAADAARDTVNSFTEVERADLAITLEQFREQPYGTKNEYGGMHVTGARLKFDVVANNLGRSSGLITAVSSGWYSSADPPKPVILTGPPRKYIVKGGESAVLKMDWEKDVATLKTERFLFVTVSYKSPLRDGERVVRTCFEVFGLNSNIAYKEIKHEDTGKNKS